VGKHGKKVVGGEWSSEGLLVTCSEDKILTISNN